MLLSLAIRFHQGEKKNRKKGHQMTVIPSQQEEVLLPLTIRHTVIADNQVKYAIIADHQVPPRSEKQKKGIR